MLSLILIESFRLTGRTLVKGTWKYVHYYKNKPYAMAVHICWSCIRGRNSVILSPPRPYQTQQDSTPTQNGRFDKKSICCSRGVTSVQDWLVHWEQEVSPLPSGQERPCIAVGAQEGRTNWKLGIQTKSQRYGPEDVTPRLHSASALQEGSLPHLVMLELPMSLKGWHPPIWNWFLLQFYPQESGQDLSLFISFLCGIQFH